jgi:hypothetical protein
MGSTQGFEFRLDLESSPQIDATHRMIQTEFNGHLAKRVFGLKRIRCPRKSGKISSQLRREHTGATNQTLLLHPRRFGQTKH